VSKVIRNRSKTARLAIFEIPAHNFPEPLCCRGARLIVDGPSDMSCLRGGGGVHVGQDDLGVAEERAIAAGTVGGEFPLTRSNSWRSDSTRDYIAIGPISDATKKNPDTGGGDGAFGKGGRG